MPEDQDDAAEPDDAGADHEVPVDLTELYEVLEFERLSKLGPNE